MPTTFGFPLVALEGIGVLLLVGLILFLGVWWFDRFMLRSQWLDSPEGPLLPHSSQVHSCTLHLHSVLRATPDEPITPPCPLTAISLTIQTVQAGHDNLPMRPACRHISLPIEVHDALFTQPETLTATILTAAGIDAAQLPRRIETMRSSQDRA
jgi:hypothetical protein